MFLTVHAAAGLFIGRTLDQPVWFFFSALVSHYALDIIPHGDESIGWWIHDRPKRIWWIGLADLGVTLALMMLYFYLRPNPSAWPLAWAVIGALLPDFLSEANYQITKTCAPLHRLFRYLTAIPFFSRILDTHNSFHHRLHWLFKRHLPWRVGLLFQSAYAAGFLGLSMIK